MLLDADADVMAKGNLGRTVLDFTNWRPKGHDWTSSVEDLQNLNDRLLLVEKVSDVWLYTGLRTAAYEGHNQRERYLLEKGDYINKKDIGGRTALHFAARWGCHSTVQLLLESGADVNITDDDGKTAMDLADDTGRELLKSWGGVMSTDDQRLGSQEDYQKIILLLKPLVEARLRQKAEAAEAIKGIDG